MDSNGSISFHTETLGLKNRIRSARLSLLKLLEDWHYLQNELKEKLSIRYQEHFGELESELNNKSLVAAELGRRAELLAISIQRGEKINSSTLSFVNRIVDREFQNDNKNGADSSKPKTQASVQNHDIPAPPQINGEIASVYRSLVKILHPDRAGESELFKRYWLSVQDAYKKGSLQRLRLFHRTLACDDDKNYPDPISEELALKNELRDLEINIEAETRRINRLREQPPFVWADKLSDERWIEKHKQEIIKNINKTDREIVYYKEMIKDITGSDDAARDGDTGDKDFQETFIRETYHKRG